VLPLIAVGLALVVLLLGVRYVPAGHAGLVERSGEYRRSMRTRVGWILPVVEHLRLVELRPYQLVMASEPFRSVDEVQLLASVRLRFQALDPVRATYEVEDLRRGVEQLAVHELRQIVSASTGGEMLRSGEKVSKQIEQRLQRVESVWGALVDEVHIEFRLFLAPPQQRQPHYRESNLPAGSA
jgi:regulator of protease activity HflC (stomatin/prohibitin superfamily)